VLDRVRLEVGDGLGPVALDPVEVVPFGRGEERVTGNAGSIGIGQDGGYPGPGGLLAGQDGREDEWLCLLFDLGRVADRSDHQGPRHAVPPGIDQERGRGPGLWADDLGGLFGRGLELVLADLNAAADTGESALGSHQGQRGVGSPLDPLLGRRRRQVHPGLLALGTDRQDQPLGEEIAVGRCRHERRPGPFLLVGGPVDGQCRDLGCQHQQWSCLQVVSALGHVLGRIREAVLWGLPIDKNGVQDRTQAPQGRFAHAYPCDHFGLLVAWKHHHARDGEEQRLGQVGLIRDPDTLDDLDLPGRAVSHKTVAVDRLDPPSQPREQLVERHQVRVDQIPTHPEFPLERRHLGRALEEQGLDRHIGRPADIVGT